MKIEVSPQAVTDALASLDMSDEATEQRRRQVEKESAEAGYTAARYTVSVGLVAQIDAVDASGETLSSRYLMRADGGRIAALAKVDL